MKRIVKAATLTIAGSALLIGGAGAAAAVGPDAAAVGEAIGSPGILSGNAVQNPMSMQANVCGINSNMIGVLAPAVETACADA